MKVFSSVSIFRFQIFLLHFRFIFASINFFRFFAKQSETNTFFSLFRFNFFRFRFASFRFKRKFGDTLIRQHFLNF
jgi:hypothetical protein